MKKEKLNEIIIFENQDVKLEVNMKDENVWLTQAQMADLFGRDVKTISKHIINAYKEELEEKCNSQKMRIANSDKPVTIYNLDTIISVGYRVKSQNGIIFRRWANKILKDYMIKGYAINQKRLEYLEKTVQLIDIANRLDDKLQNSDAKNILKVINSYSKAFDLLDKYDHKIVKIVKGKNSSKQIEYKECINIINTLKFKEESTIFALERNKGLDTIIKNIYQTFGGKDVYKSVEEKAANFLYMIVKNHVFIDGNKRIAATLFIYFLQFYDILIKDNKYIIDNNTLTSLTLLIAESNPSEKDILVNLVTNFLN